MKITNNANLPWPLVKAITNDPYTKGGADFSVTELISPARMRALMRLHGDKLTEDAADRIWSLVGKIGHGILETAGDDSGIVERRFFIKRQGKTIGGQIDLIPSECKIIDYKFTSVWSSINGVKPEWESQLNIYRLMAEENGLVINAAQIVCIFRDWSRIKAKHEDSYPKIQVQVMDVPLWDKMKTEAFIADRINAHINAREKELPQCTPEERWYRGESLAVIKKGNKRATRVYDNKEEAETHAATDPKFTVVHRPGESIRCESYCSVSNFCDQWKQEKQE